MARTTDRSPQTIETLLQAVEAEGEAAGWDSDLSGPMIFAIIQHKDGFQVEWPEGFNGVLRACLQMTEGDAGEAVQQMGEVLSTLGLRVTDDFVGLGFRSEIWMLDTSQHDPDLTLARQHRIHEHPQRIEGRNVWFFGRDGSSRWVLRKRGGLVEGQGAPTQTAGNIPNGLTRLLNALCPEDVPVVPINLEGIE